MIFNESKHLGRGGVKTATKFSGTLCRFLRGHDNLDYLEIFYQYHDLKVSICTCPVSSSCTTLTQFPVNTLTFFHHSQGRITPAHLNCYRHLTHRSPVLTLPFSQHSHNVERTKLGWSICLISGLKIQDTVDCDGT